MTPPREAAPTPSAENCEHKHYGDGWCDPCHQSALAAARAEEREACARACEGWSAPDNEFQMQGEDDLSRGLRFAAGLRARIAAAIRARSPASASTESAPAPAPLCPDVYYAAFGNEIRPYACVETAGHTGPHRRGRIEWPAPAPAAELVRCGATLPGADQCVMESGHQGTHSLGDAPASTAATGDGWECPSCGEEVAALHAEVARKDAALRDLINGVEHEARAANSISGWMGARLSDARAALAPAEKEG